MTNLELLKRVVDVAESNGFDMLTKHDVIITGFADNIVEMCNPEIDCVMHVNGIIFDHDFAKALWGEETQFFGLGIFRKLWNIKQARLCGEDTIPQEYEWEYRLQQMVLKREPLKYLSKFLK